MKKKARKGGPHNSRKQSAKPTTTTFNVSMSVSPMADVKAASELLVGRLAAIRDQYRSLLRPLQDELVNLRIHIQELNEIYESVDEAYGQFGDATDRMSETI